MKRFEKKESYIDIFGLMLTTYERNNKETTKLRIGTIIEKTYDIIGDKKRYLGCRHMTEEEAIDIINIKLEMNLLNKVNA